MAVVELIIRVNNEQVVFNNSKAMKYLETTNDYFVLNVIEQVVIKVQERRQFSNPLKHILTSKYLEEEEDKDLAELMAWLDNQSSNSTRCKQPEPLLTS